MAPKRSKGSQQASAVAAARYALNTSSQRGQPSQSRKTSSTTSSPQDTSSVASPEIQIDESSPIQSRLPPRRKSSTGLSIEHYADGPGSQSYRKGKSRSRSRSDSASSSTSSSSSSSSGSSNRESTEPESEAFPRRPSPAFSSSFSTSRSTTSLLSQRNKSYSSLSRSLYSANPANFAPPFYNRPPTPLPPSPSLTSLLRPTFSATPSRPTTPDDSDNDSQAQSRYQSHIHLPNHLSRTNSHINSSRSLANLSTTSTTGPSISRTPSQYTFTASNTPTQTQTPLPRTAPKVPTYEYYGFVLYLTSSLFFLGYVLWSYLPAPFLHRLGIYYYPDRWWSLAVPAWIVVAVAFVYVLLATYNAEILTLKLSNLGTVVDDVGVVAVVDPETGQLLVGGGSRQSGGAQHAGPSEHRSNGLRRDSRNENEDEHHDVDKGSHQHWDWDWTDCWNHSTDAVLDVPIGGVCEVLYGRKTR